jgi:6-phosphogluconate dehydrogenase
LIGAVSGCIWRNTAEVAYCALRAGGCANPIALTLGHQVRHSGGGQVWEHVMQLGMVGLGRMGGNIVRRLMRDGHMCAVFDRDPVPGRALAAEGAVAAASLADLVAALTPPRTLWVMLPAGAATEAAITELSALLAPGDTIIDGGNTNWKDDIRRAAVLRAKNLSYVDVGTSGGVWGLERGYCLMIGGDAAVVQRLDPIFKSLAPGRGDIPLTGNRETKDPRPEQGYLHAGPNGSGHFVKMIHNGIEYGMMQALAEGFDILKNANSQRLPEHERLTLDTADIAEVWRRGSVITSWLLDLTSSALAEDRELASYSGHVDDSGEGRWTVEAAIAEAVPAEVLTSALYTRFRSRQDHTFAEKVLSAMRKGFGGHVEPAKPTNPGAAKKPGAAS